MATAFNPHHDGSETKLESARDLMQHPQKIGQWISEHRMSVNAWFFCAILILSVFMFLSDRDFSFLLTLSSIVSAFSFLMVVHKIEKNSSCAGVSRRMMETYAVLISAKLIAFLSSSAYLPWDRSADFFLQIVESISLALCCTAVFLCRKTYSSTYDASSDSLNNLYLIGPVAVLALIFHPALAQNIIIDFSWTLGVYLEAVACLPQLFMFQKENKVEPFMSHFLAAQALGKVCSFIFWASTYSELSDPSKPLSKFSGGLVMLSQLVQIIVLGDFTYKYIKCLSKGVPVQFLLNENV